ncbi:MAG TPA: hypothetical protein VHO94_03260 [Oscillospiraceae bacterium]|nr:hypothetical protein [Oscillospiraceae bacterium]
MVMTISLGEVIVLIAIIASTAINITVSIKMNIHSKSNKINQSKSHVGGDQIGGNKYTRQD